MKRFFGEDVTQITLMLRVVCGGYLTYLAWELGKGIFSGDAASPLFLLAALVFAGVGLPLCLVSIKRLVRMEYTFLPNEFRDKETENEADQ